MLRKKHVAVIIILCTVTALFSMGITTTVSLLVFSKNGKSALFSLNGHGPEGGSSYSLLLMGGSPFTSVKYDISNTLSPGDGSTPEHISIAQCNAELGKLKSAIEKKGFEGITFGSLSGIFGRRSALIVSDEQRNAAQGYALKEVSPGSFKTGDLSIIFIGKTLTVSKNNYTLFSTAVEDSIDEKYEKTIFVGPNNHLLIIICRTSYQSTVSIYASESGSLTDLKEQKE